MKSPVSPMLGDIDQFDRVEMPPEAWHRHNLSCTHQFLKSYENNPETFKSYRREIERYLQWIYHYRQLPFEDCQRTDIETFIRFCQSPPVTWVATQNHRRFNKQPDGSMTANPAWRPFVSRVTKKAFKEGRRAEDTQYQLSPKGTQAIFAVLSTFYQYLLQAHVANHNPVQQIRQKSHFMPQRQLQEPVRRLSIMQWTTVIESAEKLAESDPQQHERTLFIMNLLYGLYLRVSELAASTRWQPQMNHFFRDSDSRWWFQTLGKGNKIRDISVSDSVMDSLVRYRKFLGLSMYPSPDDHTPLITKTRGHGAIGSTRQIRHIVQYCFDHAINTLQSQNLMEEADQLQSATVHWLRHTGISDDVKSRPREHVRDDAGHSSGQITDKYIDVTRIERHESGKRKRIKPDVDFLSDNN